MHEVDSRKSDTLNASFSQLEANHPDMMICLKKEGTFRNGCRKMRYVATIPELALMSSSEVSMLNAVQNLLFQSLSLLSSSLPSQNSITSNSEGSLMVVR